MKIKNSVECWLVTPNKKKVLLLQVPEKKGRAAFFQPVTGGVEAGETPQEACIREVFEETGLDITAKDLLHVFDGFKVVIDETLEINKTLFVLKTDHFLPKLSPSEHCSFSWVGADDVVANLSYQSNIDTWHLIDEKTAIF